MGTYTATATYTAACDIPDDGDDADAASVNVGLECALDNAAYLYTNCPRLGSNNTFTGTNSFSGLTGMSGSLAVTGLSAFTGGITRTKNVVTAHVNGSSGFATERLFFEPTIGSYDWTLNVTTGTAPPDGAIVYVRVASGGAYTITIKSEGYGTVCVVPTLEYAILCYRSDSTKWMPIAWSAGVTSVF